MSLGKNIKKARKTKGLTQAELAKKLGKKQPEISAWEKDEHEPGLDKIRKIAQVLSVPEYALTRVQPEDSGPEHGDDPLHNVGILEDVDRILDEGSDNLRNALLLFIEKGARNLDMVISENALDSLFGVVDRKKILNAEEGAGTIDITNHSEDPEMNMLIAEMRGRLQDKDKAISLLEDKVATLQAEIATLRGESQGTARAG